jgi:hypothetical protein
MSRSRPGRCRGGETVSKRQAWPPACEGQNVRRAPPSARGAACFGTGGEGSETDSFCTVLRSRANSTVTFPPIGHRSIIGLPHRCVGRKETPL